MNKKTERKTKYNKVKRLKKLRMLLLKKKHQKLKLARLFSVINATFLVLFIISCKLFVLTSTDKISNANIISVTL